MYSHMYLMSCSVSASERTERKDELHAHHKSIVAKLACVDEIELE